MAPVHIFIGGQELFAWTSATLRRSKSELTGSLNVSVFMGRIPDQPTMVDAAHGRQITMYIGGHLAFVGTIDRRIGTGARSGSAGTDRNEKNATGVQSNSSASVNIGPNEYTVELQCRGKTKVLINSSHQITTNLLEPKDREVVDKLVSPWGIQVEWLGEEIQLDKVRLRDGCIVKDELDRVCREQCHFMYETRDGKLRVTDGVGPTTGEPLLLGTNILAFSASQAEDEAKGRIKVKGQRIKKNIRGKEAVLRTYIEAQDAWVETDIRTTVQHYGDATPEALERRARFEANRRSANSKSVTLDVFHVQSTSGLPWDVGQTHYVEVPPEGIFDVFECTELTYEIRNNETLKTTLTLSPPPAAAGSGVNAAVPTGNLPELASDFQSIGDQRRAQAGVTFSPGLYPQPWVGPQLTVLAAVAAVATVAYTLFSTIEEDEDERVPLELPPSYESKVPDGAKGNTT